MNKNVDPRVAACTGDTMFASLLADTHQTIEIHNEEVPPAAEAALERLYGNLFSLPAYYRVVGAARNASAYVVRRGDSIDEVWLFHHEGRNIRVINEGIRIDDAGVQRFASHVFAAYPSAHVIVFHAVQPQLQTLPWPYQRANCLEDMVLTLPRSADEYTASLGKSTRSYINRYLKKLKRDFPSFEFRVFRADEADPRDILRIIEFNRQRMACKGKTSINDDEMAQRIVRLARERGLIGVITLGGRICAGTINYRVHDNYFLESLAHDPAYDDYRLGTLCCYLTICECIASGGNEYHFLWGQDDYKSRLLGVQRDLDDLVLYRSRLHMLLHGVTVAQHAANALLRQARLWLRRARRSDSVAGRMVSGALDVLRNAGLARR